MEIRFLGGFLDGKTKSYSHPPPHRVELWPENQEQVEKSLHTSEFCTRSDSQIYDLDYSQDPPVYRVTLPS